VGQDIHIQWAKHYHRGSNIEHDHLQSVLLVLGKDSASGQDLHEGVMEWWAVRVQLGGSSESRKEWWSSITVPCNVHRTHNVEGNIEYSRTSLTAG